MTAHSLGETAFHTPHTPEQPALPPDGNRTRITHPDPGSGPGQAGVFFDTTYDGLNRPFYIDNWRIWFAYKPHGAPYAAVRANGVNDFWEYEGAQRLYSHALLHRVGIAAPE